MKIQSFILTIAAGAAITLSACGSKEKEDQPLKDLFADNFLMGAAITMDQVTGADSLGQAAFLKHFNSAVAENAMKCEKIHPERDRYFWDDADKFVEFCQENDIHTVGHALIWHSQLAPWFLYDDEGNYVSADTLKQRMKDHITAVMTRYKGKVNGWDVVNEAIMEDGSYRKSGFYEILGEEYIPLSFQYAFEADSTAELYLNDYGMNVPGRRDTYVKIIKDLKDRGLRIDAIGMQSHMGMDYPDFEEYEASIQAFANTGVNVMVTEWDMSALPTIHQTANLADRVEKDPAYNPYPDGLPESVSLLWNQRMEQVVDILLKYSGIITRVNAWGVSDGDSWKNDWPMEGRTEYPLLLDRNYHTKPFFENYYKD